MIAWVFWGISALSATATFWIALVLVWTGESLSSDPLTDGSLYAFSLVTAFSTFGGFIVDFSHLEPDEFLLALGLSFGTAMVLGLLATTMYVAILVGDSSSGAPFFGICLSITALSYGATTVWLKIRLGGIQ